MFRQYTDTDSNAVLPTLQKYVIEKATIASTAGLVGVQWPHLTIIFCSIREAAVTPHSMLRFRHGLTDTQQLLPEEGVCFREHLLFVNYSFNYRELTVYGDVPFSHFQQFRELGYITVADLNPKGTCLSYPIDDLEKQFLADSRSLECYFQPLTDEHPNSKFSDRLTIEEKAEEFSTVFTEVVGLAQSKARDAAMTAPVLFKELMFKLLQNKNQDVQYYYGLVLSAMHRDFCAEFVQVQRARIALLLEFFFQTELKRTRLVKTWFSDVIQMSAPSSRAQFYGLPPECQFTITDAARKASLSLEIVFKQTSPPIPHPGMAFSVPWELAHFALEYPSAQNGRIILSHYDIIPVLENHIEQVALRQISYLQRKFHLCYAERYWNPVNSDMRLLGTGYWETILKLSRILTKDTDDEIKNGLIPFEDMPLDMDRNPITEIALPLLAGLSNLLSVEYFFPVWPPRKGLEMGNREQFYLDNPDIAELHSEAVPETRAELEEYEYWPPCMKAMVRSCKGPQHLKYHHRLRMVAQLRKFQYSPEQGAELWTTIFSETDIYSAHGNQFLNSKQGKIVVEDYARGKFERIGVSCQAWIANGFCPLGKTGAAQDIEDLQIRCTGSFNDAHPENPFPGNVQSPSDYFRMARKTLPRTVAVVVE